MNTGSAGFAAHPAADLVVDLAVDLTANIPPAADDPFDWARRLGTMSRGAMHRPPPVFTGPPPSAADPLGRALDALAAFGYDQRRRALFQAARAQGCCYQCHAPLQYYLDEFPCSHWFVTACSSIERITPVFATYALADVLHFLLLHASGPGRPQRPVSGTCAAGSTEIAVRLGRKSWHFAVASVEGNGARLTVAMSNRRTGKTTSVELPASQSDLDVMDSVARAILGRSPAGQAEGQAKR
jgi:hypothetical protein